MKVLTALIISIILSTGLLALVFGQLSPFSESKVDQLLVERGIEGEEELEQLVEVMTKEGAIYKLYDYQNVTIVAVLSGFVIIPLFAIFHILIDKLFFKTVSQYPDYRIAMRRGGIFYMAMVGLFVFYSLDNLSLVNIVSVSALGLMIEVGIERFSGLKKIKVRSD